MTQGLLVSSVPPRWGGAACWAKLFNQNFIRANLTATISWASAPSPTHTPRDSRDEQRCLIYLRAVSF